MIDKKDILFKQRLDFGEVFSFAFSILYFVLCTLYLFSKEKK